MFLHDFSPHSLAFVIGPIAVHWYGITMALAMVCALGVAAVLARYYDVKKETIIDLAFWIICGGLIGARAYEIFLEWPYYSATPAEIIKLWHGGLAIHGAIIGGAAALYIFARLKKISAWKLAAIIAPALAIGQAIGRWGNWFNQELFGRPTLLPWGIPVNMENRLAGYESFVFFHPTFLYESLAMAAVAVILIILVRRRHAPGLVVGWYFIFYGLIRFLLEFIKIDPTPLALGMRWPQIMSLFLIAFGIYKIKSLIKRECLLKQC